MVHTFLDGMKLDFVRNKTFKQKKKTGQSLLWGGWEKNEIWYQKASAWPFNRIKIMNYPVRKANSLWNRSHPVSSPFNVLFIEPEGNFKRKSHSLNLDRNSHKEFSVFIIFVSLYFPTFSLFTVVSRLRIYTNHCYIMIWQFCKE